MCDGPPFRKRKMTRLARGAKCGARVALPANKAGGASNPPSPTRPNPAHMLRSIWRRLRNPPPVRAGGGTRWCRSSVHIEHFVRGQEQLRVLLPSCHLRRAGFVQEFQSKLQFRPLRLAAEEKAIGVMHA